MGNLLYALRRNSDMKKNLYIIVVILSPIVLRTFFYLFKSLSTNKLILIAPCAILSSRKNNGGKHGNDKAENMGNNG